MHIDFRFLVSKVGPIGMFALVCAVCATRGFSQEAPTQSERDREFAELAREADEFQKKNILRKAIHLVRPSVVHIDAHKTETAPSGRVKTVEEAGSGVVIEENGRFYVLTNRHVIRDAQLNDVKIKLADGRLIFPKQAWNDPDTDVALMAIEADKLVPARIGDSDKSEIGDFVIAFGSPFGLAHSVTYGILSAKGRRDLTLGDRGVRYQDFLQTDAAINPGNSGGPLLNLRGEVIGVNTAIASTSGSTEGVGFAIPINMARYVAGQLLVNGRVIRGYLGVHLDSKFGAEAAQRLGLPRPLGARVSLVTPNSPAAVAEIKEGDVIVRFGDVLIDDDNHLVAAISTTPVDREVDVVVYRGGKPYTRSVKLHERR